GLPTFYTQPHQKDLSIQIQKLTQLLSLSGLQTINKLKYHVIGKGSVNVRKIGGWKCHGGIQTVTRHIRKVIQTQAAEKIQLTLDNYDIQRVNNLGSPIIYSITDTETTEKYEIQVDPSNNNLIN